MNEATQRTTQIEAEVRKLREVMTTVETEMKKIDYKARMGLKVEDQKNEVADLAAETNAKIEMLLKEKKEIEDKVIMEIKRQAREEIRQEAQHLSSDLNFHWVKDAYQRAALCAAVAQSAQFQLAYGEEYFASLAAQLYTRKHGNDTGTTVDDSLVPEISRNQEELFERLQEQRRDLEITREIAEKAYRDACDEIQIGSPKPNLYFRTDEEIKQQRAERRAEQLLEQGRREEVVGTLAGRVYLAEVGA